MADRLFHLCSPGFWKRYNSPENQTVAEALDHVGLERVVAGVKCRPAIVRSA